MTGRHVTICCTYFRSLDLAALEAALYAVSKQHLGIVAEVVLVDNNTTDSTAAVVATARQHLNGVVRIVSVKHGDATRTHAWSSNVAVRHAQTPWVLFCRADYLLSFDLVSCFTAQLHAHAPDWDGFVTSNCYHLDYRLPACEALPWRSQGPEVLRALPGNEIDYTSIDAGVWMARHDAVTRVGGLDERLTAWGHAQTHFQHKLHTSGVDFVRIPTPLFFHPWHDAERDLTRAHKQLAGCGIDLKELWARHDGEQVYR